MHDHSSGVDPDPRSIAALHSYFHVELSSMLEQSCKRYLGPAYIIRVDAFKPCDCATLVKLAGGNSQHFFNIVAGISHSLLLIHHPNHVRNVVHQVAILFLRFAQGPLRRFGLSDIAHNSGNSNDRALGVLDWRISQGYLNAFSVFAEANALELRNRLAFENSGK